ncbi:MAG: nucleoside recognition protein [Parabacteroides sp.]|uniref:Nucleoside transporter/FeoB GTPase Gate domain-containing protein n=1 Tax=bioreactor metagenome TaxID=1076179 RepID=A0A644VBY8_9ZZZZ|nr:nucleoside recognition protein [Parabacteroides sp.]
MGTHLERIWLCIKNALPKSARTCIWLLKIILPISLLVRLLEYSGWLAEISGFLSTLFSLVGLPGETAIIFITSTFGPLYAPIALITSMSLGLREATILAIMCLVSHNLIVESSIQAKTGSSFWGMTILRVSMSFLIAFTLNLVLPEWSGQTVGKALAATQDTSLKEVLILWITGSMSVIITILLIVTGLMILHNVLDEFRLMKKLSDLFAPLMKIFGLPRDAAFLWLVGNVVGLAYGGAIMVEQMQLKKLTQKEGHLLNHHLAVSHSLLEDTVIFVAIGIPALWILGTRLLFAIAVVWGRRLYNFIYSRNVIKRPLEG